MELERAGARMDPRGHTNDPGPSIGDAAGRVQEAGERLLVKRLDLLRLEAAALARAGGLGIAGCYLAAVGVLLLSAAAVVWLDVFWPLELAFLAVAGSEIVIGLIVLAVAVRRASGGQNE
jgi:hypothetical protein